MGSDRTALAVIYSPGDEVLVHQLTGGGSFTPVRAKIVEGVRSRVYAYKVQAEERSWFVRESWICPADIQIEEVSDTPWE